MKLKEKDMTSIMLKEGVEMPQYETELASGRDLVVNSILRAFKGEEEITGDKLERMRLSFERGTFKMRGFERILFGSGVIMADIPSNLEFQIRDRSGVALKKGLLVANSPGTIDADFRGEMGIILINSTPYLIGVKKGERLAQMVSSYVQKEELARAYEIIPTKRGEGAYNSTGL